MNFIEAIEQLRAGKKIRSSKWNEDDYIGLDEFGYFIKPDGGYRALWFSGIEDLDDDNWEIYKSKISDKEQTNLDAFKFRILNACADCTDCCLCPVYEICVNKSNPEMRYLEDWTKKEIVNAYKLLKEVK